MAQSYGFRGRVLRVDLTSGEVRVEEHGADFFRMYLGGGAIGAWYLLRETAADTDPLGPDNLLTIAPGVTTGAAVSGVSRCSVTALSPVTGTIGDGQAGGSIGPAIKRAGYDAIVIRGRAARPSYLYVDGDDVEVRDASALAGRSISEVHRTLGQELGTKDLSILQCGPAGERMVCFASLTGDRNNVVGRGGLGAVFGSKNLRAVAVRGAGEVPLADPKAVAAFNKRAVERLPGLEFPTRLREVGTPGVVIWQASGGNLATENYARGCIEGYEALDGTRFHEHIGSKARTCFGCIIRCRKTVKASQPYEVSDELGGPEFETLGMLGSNLGITDPVAVSKANELCNELGLDTITMGGVAGYLTECCVKGLLSAKQIGRELAFGDPEGVFWLIEQVAKRDGIGEVMADGIGKAVDKLGAATAPCAVHVKNQGLAVHMPQVKPSLALIYAVCPIGPDHMSSEHDWLITSEGDDARGLGILGVDTKASTSLAKVRMAAYSHWFYSAMDALNLCMFVWGPGSVFPYHELEELLRATTGWGMTMFEVMKAGERRINMMRQLNARRGFTRADDRLPERLFEPLPDGPSAGAHVDREAFEGMLDQYFDIAGWERDTGNPTPGKLAELGLDWTLEA